MPIILHRHISTAITFVYKIRTLGYVFSKLLTTILTAAKGGPQSYHNTCYSRSGINSMWDPEKFETSSGDPQFKNISRI